MLSKKIQTVAPSLTLQITAKAKALKASGIDVISFGAGEPDFDTPDNIKQKAIEAIQNGFTKYTPASGIPALKKAIVEKFKKENALTYGEKNIVISCGAKHSLFNVFQVLLNDGDEVLIPSPYWLSYPEMVKLAGGVPVVVSTDKKTSYKATVEMLSSCVTDKTKALILTSPSNPTGVVYQKEELEEIARFACERSIYVISDEIYENIMYDGRKHISIASLGSDIKERTIVVNGMSKSYAMTGWRIGYIAAPEDITKAIGTLQSHSTSNPTSFAQIGALEALEGGLSEVLKMRKVFEKRRDLMMEEISKIDKISAVIPQGAFYVFCDISKTGLSSLDFATRLLEEANVAVIPSEPFGIGQHIRLSFAISDEAIKTGLGRIRDWTQKLRV